MDISAAVKHSNVVMNRIIKMINDPVYRTIWLIYPVWNSLFWSTVQKRDRIKLAYLKQRLGVESLTLLDDYNLKRTVTDFVRSYLSL